MKLLKKLMIITLCMSMFLLASCNKENEVDSKENISQGAMGRYVEKNFADMNIEEKGGYIWNTLIRKDNSLDIYICYNSDPWIELYNTKDGISFEKKDIGSWYFDILNMQYFSISDIDYDSDDNIYVLARGEENETYKTSIFKITSDNQINEINMEWKKANIENTDDDMGNYAKGMKVNSKDELIINQPKIGVIHYGNDGKYKAQYGNRMTENYTLSDEYVYVLDSQQSKIKVYNMGTYEFVRDIDYNGITNETNISAGRDGGIYVTDRTGVYKIAKNGTIFEKIIDGELTSLAIPALYYSCVYEGINDDFYISFSDVEQQSKIMKYEYDENIPTLPSVELTIYTLNENATLRQVAGELQKQNTDLKVNIKVGISEDSSITKTDAIKLLNGELLAGKGPDLILLDGLPVSSYMSKGVLEDLSDIVNKYMNSEDKLLSNVVNTYKQGEKIQAIPTKFYIPSIWMDEKYKDYMKNLDTFMEFIQENNDKPSLVYFEPDDLIKTFTASSFPKWINENKEINEESLSKFLEYMKILYTYKGDFKKDDQDFNTLGDKFNIFANENNKVSRVFNWALDNVYGCYSLLSSYKSFTIENLASEKRGGGVPFILPGQLENAFVPVNSIGINKNTQKMDISKDFVKLMLSENVQNAQTNDGFPVNLKSLEHGSLGIGNEYLYIGLTDDLYGDLEGSLPSAERLNLIKDLCFKVENPSVLDEVLVEIIVENSREYLEGEMDIEQTIEKIKEKTKLYLSE